MTNLFLRILNMSLSATWLALAVILLRFALKKTPKWVNVLLWGLVAIRLVCPFTLESSLSLVPSAQPIPQEILVSPPSQTQLHVESITAPAELPVSEDTPDAQPLPSEPAAAPEAALSPLSLLTGIWVSGTALLFLYTLLSYLRLRRKVRMAIRVKGNIYLSEFVSSPFVLGILKPRIYLPYHMPEPDRTHVIAHERTHIYRRDHWWKPLGFLLLSIHWFNPVLWAAYILLCRDIEMACDERVIQTLTREQRADYSQALLHCSVSRRSIAACPLAFGEVGVRRRVRNVLRYQKPTFWIILISPILILVLSVCFLTNPKSSESPFGQVYLADPAFYSLESTHYDYAPQSLSQIRIAEDGTLTLLDEASQTWALAGSLEKVTLTEETFDARFDMGYVSISPADLRTGNQNAWYLAPDSPNAPFSYLLCQKDGSRYLLRGFLDDSQQTIESYQLFTLEDSAILSLTGQNYQVSGILYGNPTYSSTWLFRGDLPYLSVTNSQRILVRDVNPIVAPEEDAPWADLGKARSLTLTAENFDGLFQTREGQKTARELRRENRQAWKVTNQNNALFYLLLQESGDLLLAYGPEAADSNIFRFLLKLEPASDMDWSASMEIHQVDRSSCYLSMYLVGPLPDGVCVLGGESIQVKQGTSWQDVPPLMEGLSHADQIIEDPEYFFHGMHWEETHGVLPDGTYRVKQTITFCNADGSLDSKDFYAEFTLSSADTTLISLELLEVTPRGLRFVDHIDPSITGNTAMGEVWIEAYRDGKWITMEPTVDIEPIFNTADRRLPLTNVLSSEEGKDYWQVNWTSYYGELPTGTYRLCSEYTSLYSGAPPGLQIVYADFSIAPDHGIHIVVDEIREDGAEVEILLEDSVQPGTYFLNHTYLQPVEHFDYYPLIPTPDGEKPMIDILELPSISMLTTEKGLLSRTQLRIVLVLTQILPNGQEEEFLLFKYLDPANYAWGITMDIQDGNILLTCPDVPFGDKEFTYDTSYTLEKRANNQWNAMEYAMDLPSGTLYLPSNITINAQPLPDLPSGTYRLSKNITRHYADGTTKTRTISAVFTLEDADDLVSIPDDYTLEQAAADGVVTFVDTSIHSNETVWQNFLNDVNQGKKAHVRTMQYFNLPDADSVAPDYYASIKDIYPYKFYRDISYDGNSFTLETLEGGAVTEKRYQYLRCFTGTAPEGTSPAYDSYEHYILTNDAKATYDELWKSIASSQFGAYIDHVTVFSRYTYPS